MTGAIAMRQREATMPIAAPMVPPPAMCAPDHRSPFAITYEWNGGDRGDLGLTANHSPRRLGRSST
jgi:hypothetical protein